MRPMGVVRLTQVAGGGVAPIVETRARNNENNNSGTTYVVGMPADIQPGDLLLAFVARNSGTPFSGWTSGWSAVAAVTASIYMYGVLLAKIADGGDTLTVTQSSGYWRNSLVWRISGCDNLSSVYAAGAAGIDPPALSGLPTGNYLSIAILASAGSSTFTGYPAGYGETFYSSVSPQHASCEKTLSMVSAEDPGAFTTTNSHPITMTVLVAP